MWKHIYCAAVTAVLLLSCILSPQKEGIFRLHIIANSNSVEDQAAKLIVRDAVIAYERDMENAQSAEAVKNELMQDGSGIMEAVEDALRRCGMEYGAELHIGSYHFPNREYGNAFYPEGEYEALRIILGEGKGENWWCVMFPPLCILESPYGEIENEGQFQSLILKLIREAKQNETKE